ncbi:hypothetical protein CJ030_MR7G001371 [Morella rubra]|uniref:BTB domain-containing protein n=1 Tax=Morella rubra TaxID=262757 RepID=A0A6A1V6D2_9ROSI|nr:hypothetical protein CJ030_MR7G001371 [Morella rubra]
METRRIKEKKSNVATSANVSHDPSSRNEGEGDNVSLGTNVECERPIGRKAEKAKRKIKDGLSEDAVELMKKKTESLEDARIQGEELVRLEHERVEIERRKLHLQELDRKEILEIKKRKLQLQELDRKKRIMMIDTTMMSDLQKQYWNACQKEILEKITDKKLKNNDDFVWAIEVPLTGKVIIDIEFLDLKTASPDGRECYSIWADGFAQKRSNATALASLGRMLTESIHTDIIINASDGSIGAHRAVLAARSPVFRSMFSHNLKEKEMSTIDISDISIETCKAFLNYIYGNIQHEDFLTHRLALLRAADKYDISDLKETCHESLLEDIDAKNVLERLQNASLYQLPDLKTSCMRYLVNFGKIFDIRDDLNAFLQTADRDLIADIFHEVLNAWKGF